MKSSSSFFKWLLLTSAVTIGILLTILILSIFFINPIQVAVESVHGLFYQPKRSLTDSEWIALSELVFSGQLLTSQELLIQVTNFYTNLINTLIALIAILGVIAFLYVKASSSDVMEQAAENTVKAHFEKQRFKDELTTLISRRIEDVKDGAEIETIDIENIVETLEELSEKVRVLEDRAKKPNELSKLS